MDEQSARNQDYERGAALEALRYALIAGEKSGGPHVVDLAAFLKQMRIAHESKPNPRNV